MTCLKFAEMAKINAELTRKKYRKSKPLQYLWISKVIKSFDKF